MKQRIHEMAEETKKVLESLYLLETRESISHVDIFLDVCLPLTRIHSKAESILSKLLRESTQRIKKSIELEIE